MTDAHPPLHTLWPCPEAPGRYAAVCSCGIRKTGTARELHAWSRSHDDSPGRAHIVHIAEGGRRIDSHHVHAMRS
jgi:hypothetical protein